MLYVGVKDKGKTLLGCFYQVAGLPRSLTISTHKPLARVEALVWVCLREAAILYSHIAQNFS